MIIQRKRVAKRLASGLLAGALALGGLAISGGTASAVDPDTKTTNRLGGATRYDTASAIARKWVTDAMSGSPTNLIFASGTSYADALAAASLSGVKNAPVLLVTKDSIPQATADFLSDYGTSLRANNGTMYIVGGEAVVSAEVEAALKATVNIASDATPQTFKRLGGNDRYETAQLIMNQSGILTASDSVILVGGDDSRWPDALSAGPLAAQKGWPIIPVPGSGLAGTSKAMVDKYLTLSGSSNKYVIIGGPLAVPSSVEEYLINSLIPVANIRRVQGADRYQTNLQVNLYEFGELGAPWNAQVMALTTGQAPWDAIAAAGWAGTKSGTAVHLVMTESTGLNSNAATLIGATAALANGPTAIHPLGGQAAIPSAIVAAAKAVGNSVNITSSITSGCVEGSSTLEITFSDALDATEQGIIDNSQILINSVAQSAAQPATDAQFLITSVGTTMTATLAAPLANGDVVSYLGITSAANTSAARAIAGASCTVANDVDGPTLEVIAPKGGSTFFIKSDTKLSVLAAAAASNGQSTAAGTADATKLSVDDITIGGTTAISHIEIDALNTGGTLFEVKAYSDGSSTAVALPAGMTISVDQSKVKDIAGNAGSGTATATVGAVADSTKPTATAVYACEQKGFSGAALAATSTTPSFTAKSTKDPGTTGNGYKVYIVNQRGLLIPTFAFDATAKTLTLTADVNYHTVADIKTAASNAGFDRFTIGGTVTANAVVTSAAGATMAGGNQHCLMAITPSEYLKASASSVTEVTVGGATVTASAGESAANGSLAAALDAIDGGTAGIYVSAESITITYITTNTGAPTAKLTIVDYQSNSNTGVSVTALG